MSTPPIAKEPEVTGLREKLEEWAWIPGYEGLYKVSADGQIMRSGKLLKLGDYGLGYDQVSLSRGGVITCHRVHSVVMRTFVGERPRGLEVNHKDGNKKNNAVTNLEYVTREENEAHALHNGLKPSHERHGCAKLTYVQVLEVRRRAANGETCIAIANDFPVHRGTISKIVRGLLWSENERMSQVPAILGTESENGGDHE